MKQRASTLVRLDLVVYDRKWKMIKRIFVPLLATLFLAGLLGTLAGCNTIEGVGKDIQQGGKAIKDEAREIRKQL